MTWYKDLSACTYWDRDGDLFSPQLKAVGWLEKGSFLRRRAFRKGTLSASTFERLCELFVRPWEGMYGFRGYHSCSLCQTDIWPLGRFKYHGWWLDLGRHNLFIPGDGFLYVAPSLIIHYIHEHQYLPPAVFCDAVMRCPPIFSNAYFLALHEHGPVKLGDEAIEAAQKEQGITAIMAADAEPVHILLVDEHPEVAERFYQVASSQPALRLHVSSVPAADLLMSEQPIVCDLAFIDIDLPGEIVHAVGSQFHASSGSTLTHFLRHGCGAETNGTTTVKPLRGRLQYYCWPFGEREIAAFAEQARHQRAEWVWYEEKYGKSDS